MERLKGEYDALVRCADKSTLSDWRRTIEVMESVDGLDIETNLAALTPSHACELARHAPKETWPEWVQRCENERLTVSQVPT